MADITIPIETPGVRQVVTAKTFNEAFILDLSVRAHEIGASDTIYVEYCPYDKVTGERLLSDRREIRLPLWESVEMIPEAAIAFGAIAAAIPALVAYQTAKAAISE